jgi:hypothetical protein
MQICPWPQSMSIWQNCGWPSLPMPTRSVHPLPTSAAKSNVAEPANHPCTCFMEVLREGALVERAGR